MKKTSIFTRENDIVWFLIWFFVLALLFIWDSIFLDTQNNPAFRRVLIGTLNTGFVGLLSVVITVALAIYVVLVIQIFKKGIFKPFYIVIQFILNFIRSIPQVVGVLLGYLGLSLLVEYNLIHNRWSILALTSCCISLFMVNEVIDLLVDRIKYFKKNDFYNAMRVSGIAEMRIITRNILWNNSKIHIFNKCIALFAMAVFLQCSVDFIISVGLSSGVNSVNLPPTLGSLLAHIQSKEDIQAITKVFVNPSYIIKLPFQHLQGISIAFIITWTLLCFHNISEGFARRHRL